jgi:hypothetical protein
MSCLEASKGQDDCHHPFDHYSTPSACDLVLLKSLLESRRPTYLGMESDPLHAPGLPPPPFDLLKSTNDFTSHSSLTKQPSGCFERA